MRITSSFLGLTVHERADFAARCRQYGFTPEQFRLSVDTLCPPLDELAPMSREIDVTYPVHACRRRYRMDGFPGWLDAFERDLSDGCFDAGCSEEWA